MSEIEEYPQGEAPVPKLPIWQTVQWNTREVVFVSEYLMHRNATRAYRVAMNVKAGPHSPKVSAVAQSWLYRPHILTYIEHVQNTLKERLAVTRDNVLNEIAKLAFANLADFIVLDEDGNPATDLSGLTNEQFAALQECTIETHTEGKGDAAREVKSVKIKLAPKIAALELAGKTLKMFTDVIETGAGDIAEEIRQARLAARDRRIEHNANERKSDGETVADDDDGDYGRG